MSESFEQKLFIIEHRFSYFDNLPPEDIRWLISELREATTKRSESAAAKEMPPKQVESGSEAELHKLLHDAITNFIDTCSKQFGWISRLMK